jgi:hypothetical protein
MKRGDHIYIYYVTKSINYTHHGIYYGDDKVIHYYKGEIQCTALSKFGNKSKIRVKKYKKFAPKSVVIRRAKSRIGEKLYNPIFNNCEHFAYWCKTGKHKSKQADYAPKKLLNELDKKSEASIKIKSLKRVKLKLPKTLKVKPLKIRFKVPCI